ncbi:hypothetical protein EfmGK961_19360 [Enterococcus faecium]|nr:hypothetical protein EfmGK961_19360 [Enterococcus faecium]
MILKIRLMNETPVSIVAKQLKRGRQTIYNVYNFLKCGGTALEYFEQYKENKRRCGRTEIIFPASSEKMDYQKKWNSTKSIKDSSHPLRPKETISLENH